MTCVYSIQLFVCLLIGTNLEYFLVEGGAPFTPLHYATHVNQAVESGIKEATNLYENVEPDLYKKKIFLSGDHPSVYLAAINRQSLRAKELARAAYATLKATSVLKEEFAKFRGDLEFESLKHETPVQYWNCPNSRQLEDCRSSHKDRTADGTCNNLKNPVWGSSFQPFGRFLPPEYDDGISTIRKSITGADLPSPRRISTAVHKDISRLSSSLTLMLMQWGQFLDHDLTLTSQTRAFNHSVPKCCHVEIVHPDCLPIKIPSDDPYFNDTDCMEFIRSSPAPSPDCALGPRQQLNQLTSWLDGSVLYGSTEADLKHLRLFKQGKLDYHALPNRKPLLPRLHHPHEGECIIPSPRLFCFSAGDGRANEQPGLTTMHTLWMRQHNLIAEKLALLNPSWSDESLFDESRKIVTAQIQHITFKEFLPLVLGPNIMKVFGLRLLKIGFHTGYNDSIDGTIPSSFGTAAFRFGHSLVAQNLLRSDEWHKEMPYKVDLSSELMSPSNLHNLGEIDRITLGLASQMSQRRDEFITSQLTNQLFRTQGHKGLDLAAINIQRGRDHGLPPYLKWREACGLLKPLVHNGPIVNWKDFAEATGISADRVEMFSSTYESPWDVDLFPGGMVELPARGGLVGPTFACIIGQTFRNLRRGDRFWYENSKQFTIDQLQALRNITLARFLCDTSDSITTMQPIVFLAPHQQKNIRASCSNYDAIPQIDFIPWRQIHTTNTELSFRDSLESLLQGPEPEVGDGPPHYYSMIEFSDPGEESTDEFANLKEDFVHNIDLKLQMNKHFNW